MAIPSIAFIPSGFKASKAYSVLPTNGNADLDVVRNSTATRINEGGLIEIMGLNVPRLDYINGTCPSLLLEPQSTNLTLQSSLGVYDSGPTSVNLTTSPDGTNNGQIPVPSSTSNRFAGPISAGTYATDSKVVYSWYRKRITTPVVTVYVGDLNFNVLVNCTQVGSTTQIETDINGYDRFQGVFNITDGSLYALIRGYFGQVVGVGNSSVAYWGHQLESGTFATSLIYTTGTPVTRLKDEVSKSGLSSEINSEEGVLFVEMAALADSSGFRQIALSDGTLSNVVHIYYTNTSNSLVFYLAVGGSIQVSSTVTISDETKNNKIAAKWKANDFSLWVNGSEVVTDTSGISFAANVISKLSFDNGEGTNPFYGKVKQLQVFKTALDDATLAALTS